MRRTGKAAWLHYDLTRRGVTAWLLCGVLFAFYIILYFGYPHASPIGWFERFQAAIWPATSSLEACAAITFGFMPDEFETSRWHLYGLLYSVAMLTGGVYVMHKYRRNAYQLVRTMVVVSVQVSFAFSIPILLKFFGNPEYYFSYFWPLKIEYLDPKGFAHYGEILVLYGFFASLILVPVLTVIYGKRWYCSWVCGCGGLANTFGEPWRHLSTKSTRSWQIEKITVHAVLGIALVSTALWIASALLPDSSRLYAIAEGSRRYYGIIIGAVLSGAVGVGLYPIMGTRVWCRFFCPMAALLGLIQKVGRFRIRVKRDMCISCGLCSTYCEMGIDVRAYAQANQSFTRASCVGCGICEEVCPRGVLHLENRRRRDPQELTMARFLDESWRDESANI